VVAGVMMIKALDRSTRIYMAMLSRGFDESSAAPPYFEGAIPRQDMLWLIWGSVAVFAWLALDLVLR
jgi:cobalt/nickel transport system permease protein